MEVPRLAPRQDAKPVIAPTDAQERHQEGLFVLKLHWGVILLAPVLTFLSGRATPRAAWFILGGFVLFTAVLQALVSLRPAASVRPGLGYVILVCDLLLVTGLVWARGRLATDAYHFYYLVIVGASILFGGWESLGFAVAAGVLYGLVVLWGAFTPTALERVIIRTVYFVLTGAAAAYLSLQEGRQRLARAHVQRFLADLQEAHTRLKVHAREMSQRAVSDGLTGLYNHTYLHQRLDEELGRAKRYGGSLSLLMLDLDDFKAYNDRLGHLEGDKVLAEVARIISRSVRKADIVCRYGGEEFAVIMPETDTPAALTAAERIRQAVEESIPPDAAGEDTADRAPRPTVSIGVATYPHHAAARIPLIEAADRALYFSKHNGKNLVSADPNPLGGPGDGPIPAGIHLSRPGG